MTSRDEIIGIEEVKEEQGNIIWRAIIAEFLGNLLLNLFGCYACLVGLHFIGIALTFGLTIYLCVLTLGHVSGGHFNPAVTIAMFITCNIGLIKTLIYIVAQCAGAIVGSALVLMLTPKDYESNYGNTQVNVDIYAWWQGMVCEGLQTFFLVLVVFAFCDPQRDDTKCVGALAVGSAIAVAHLAFIGLTGASMNPARSLGSAVVANQWDHHYIYWVGPIVGGIVAGLLYTSVFAKQRFNSAIEEEIAPKDE